VITFKTYIFAVAYDEISIVGLRDGGLKSNGFVYRNVAFIKAPTIYVCVSAKYM